MTPAAPTEKGAWHFHGKVPGTFSDLGVALLDRADERPSGDGPSLNERQTRNSASSQPGLPIVMLGNPHASSSHRSSGVCRNGLRQYWRGAATVPGAGSFVAPGNCPAAGVGSSPTPATGLRRLEWLCDIRCGAATARHALQEWRPRSGRIRLQRLRLVCLRSEWCPRAPYCLGAVPDRR